jgi:hypothetical protein
MNLFSYCGCKSTPFIYYFKLFLLIFFLMFSQPGFNSPEYAFEKKVFLSASPKERRDWTWFVRHWQIQRFAIAYMWQLNYQRSFYKI